MNAKPRVFLTLALLLALAGGCLMVHLSTLSTAYVGNQPLHLTSLRDGWRSFRGVAPTTSRPDQGLYVFFGRDHDAPILFPWSQIRFKRQASSTEMLLTNFGQADEPINQLILIVPIDSDLGLRFAAAHPTNEALAYKYIPLLEFKQQYERANLYMLFSFLAILLGGITILIYRSPNRRQPRAVRRQTA